MFKLSATIHWPSGPSSTTRWRSLSLAEVDVVIRSMLRLRKQGPSFEGLRYEFTILPM